MPWDQSHLKTFEVQQKTPPKLSPAAFRSGCYKRAITIVQNEHADNAGRDATAASLYRLVVTANRKLATESKDASGQEAGSFSQQHNQPDKENHRQDKLQVQLIKQQRRERQEQRHEQIKHIWQRRHEEKVKLRQEELAARTRQQEEERNDRIRKLQDRQQGLQEQLQQHRQKSVELSKPEELIRTTDKVAAPQKQLLEVQDMKAKAEQQLAMVRLSL